MAFLLGVDLGTMLIKAAIFSEKGELVSATSKEVAVEFPRPGWAEQDPETLWKITCNVIKSCLRKSGISSSEIAGVGLSGQMHGTFLINHNRELARPKAIIWLDSRSQEILNEYYQKGFAGTIYERTGWRLIPSMQVMHLSWLKRNEPETLKKSKYFVACKDFIRYKLTGEIYTDITDASVTGLFSISNKSWSEEITQLLNLDIDDILPEIRMPWEYAGEITPEAAKQTGLKAGTPVTIGAGDICSTALGAGVIEPGQLCIIIGTAGIYELVTNKPILDPEKTYSIVCHAVPDSWLLGSFQMTAGACLRLFKDEFCYEEIIKARKYGNKVYELLDKKAEQSPVGSNGLIFHPFLHGERSPFVKPAMRGLLFGLSLKTKKEDVVRSILEGVGYAAKDNIDVFKSKNLDIREARVTGGISNSPVWCQILADILNMNILVPSIRDSGILGSIIEASIIAKLYNNPKEAAKKMVRVERIFEPNRHNAEKYLKLYSLYKKLYTLLWDFYEEFTKTCLEL
jgi:xylulokinase